MYCFLLVQSLYTVDELCLGMHDEPAESLWATNMGVVAGVCYRQEEEVDEVS